MEKGRDKVMKTYGRHKNRVIKTDFWDSEFNICRQNLFNLSNDDSDFVEAKLSKNVCKRKKIKGENKENTTTKGKSKQGKQRRIDHNLFSEKETTSSFTDCGEGGPLKNIQQKNVPAAAQKSRLGNHTKLRFEESQVQTKSKEQNLSVNFSEFDSYNLYISNSPARTNVKTTEASVSNGSDHLGKVLSPEIFSSNAKPSTQNYSFKPLNQKNGIFPKPKNSGITSTPLGFSTAVSRLPNNIKNHHMPDDYSLFEQSHTDTSQDDRSSMTSLNEQDESIRFSTPRMAPFSRSTKDNQNKNNSMDLFESKLDDCALRLNPDPDTDHSLNLSQRFEQIVSLGSKEKKSSSGKKQLSIETGDVDDNYRSNDRDVTENICHSEISVCANCSFNDPCGDRCAYKDVKLNLDFCSVNMQKLQSFFVNLVKTEESGELEMNVSTPRKSLIAMLSPQKSSLSPRSKVLKQCEQDDFISFNDCIAYSMMKNCVKIGEGAYGEVFRTKKKGESVALKIIPIEGDFEVNDCLQKDFREIFPEIVISKELSDLRNGIDDNTPNFVSVNSVNCLKGAYPAPLMREWDIFHKQKRSENDRPDIFDKNQLFILFNFGDGGSALETFKFSNVRQAKSVLQQVAYGLAIAESAVEFEHRDLHWGNVLVRPCPNENLHFKLKGSDIHLPSWGIDVSIIDFTLSRLQQDGCTVFCDLAKDDLLFEGKGDYQFDVYRLMREEIGNQWDRYCPKTNVYWIHYLADKLLKCKKYEKSTREDDNIQRSLRKFVREVTDYTSAANLVTTCPFMMASFLS